MMFLKFIPVVLLMVQSWGLIYFFSITFGWNSVRNTGIIYNIHFIFLNPYSIKLKDGISFCPMY